MKDTCIKSRVKERKITTNTEEYAYNKLENLIQLYLYMLIYNGNVQRFSS